MNVDLIKDNISPAEGEQSVRSYFCTYYKAPLLGLKANGYLGITNKRVIYQSRGSSRVGSNVIQSEVPIADISGINIYKGFYFNLGSLLSGLFLTVLFGAIVVGILGGVRTLEAVNSLNNFSQNNQDQAVLFSTVLGWIIGLGGFIGMFALKKKMIWRAVLAGIATTAFGYLGAENVISSFSFDLFGGSQNDNVGYLLIIPAVISLIFAIVQIIKNAWKPTFSLTIGSKGGASTPIAISGAGIIGLLGISVAKTFLATPAEDADAMLNELGAVILDVQTLGDLGINKWKVN